jgi:hypothetical protein
MFGDLTKMLGKEIEKQVRQSVVFSTLQPAGALFEDGCSELRLRMG